MVKILILMCLWMAAVPANVAFADLGQIFQTIGGVESDVKGSVSDVNAHTMDVFKQVGIESTGLDTENYGSQQTIKGKKSDMEVEVQLTQTSPNLTHVIVTAKQGTLSWNKGFAQQILSKIIQAG